MDKSLVETEEKILASISTPEKLGDDIKFFTKCINQITKGGVIKGASSEQTEHFINEFIPKLIEAILSSRVEHAQGIPMNEYLEAIIPLFTYFFFDKKKSKFIEKSSEIITKGKSPFYISTMPYQIIQKSIISPFYDTNLTAFGKTNIIQLTMNEMKSTTIDGFNSYFNALKLIHKHRRYFDQRVINSFVHASIEFYEKIFSSIDESKMRSLSEKDTKESFSDLNQLAPESSQDHKSLEKIRFNLALQYVKTPYLSKRYYGLSFIKSELSFGIIDRDILCSKLESERLISYLLDNMHDELVSDFCSIFRTMAIKGSIVENQLSNFWNISIHQNPITIEPYFSGWNIIYTGLPKDLKICLWKIMVNSDIFPIAALKFIKKASLLGIDDEQKIPLFHVLKSYYEECTEDEVLEVLSDTLSSLVPDNKEFTENLQKECFQLFKEQKQLDLALSLFKASFLNSMNSEKARQSFDLIMTSINNAKSINNVQFLEVIEKVLKKMKGNLNDEEFNNLLQLLVRTIQLDSDSVFKFYQNISMKDSLIQKEQTIQLYTEICKLKLNDLQFQNFIIYLFNKINKSNFCTDSITNKSIPKDASIFTGIDNLWDVCFRTSGSKISLYLCQLYANSKKASNTQVYIKRCMDNAENPSALLALFHIIRFIESNFEKSLLGIIENRYISQFDYCSVRLIGDVNLTIRVPQDISFCAFRDRVSVITKIEKERLTFYEGVNMISTQSFVLFDSLQLEVRKWNSTIRKIPDVEVKYIPSTILSKEKYQKKLFKLINSNDEQVASGSFLILNELPTNSQEKDLLISKSPNWDEIFDISHLYLLYYRIHSIGHLAQNNEIVPGMDIKWIDYFYETGGAKTLFEHFFTDSFNAKDNSKQFSILLEICNLIISKMTDKEKKKTILSDKTIDIIVNQALEITKNEEYESTLLLLLGILEKFSESDSSFVLNCKAFKYLFEGTIFSSNKLIRVLITTIIKRINLNDIRKDLLSLIDASVHSKCKEYFQLFLPLVKSHPNPSLLFKKIKKMIYREYYISESNNSLLALTFIPPNKYFTWGIFSAANILVQSIEKVSGIQKLFNFIIEHVLFNNFCYFEVNSDFYSFLTFLIKKDPSLLHSLLPKMKTITQISPKSDIDNDADIHLSHSLKPKGLINLGATCYMNSSVQQLFNISEFRNEILRSENGDGIDWFYHLQFLLAQLLLYPTDCIDPTHFVQNWKWYDNEIVNVHEQMDAGEFINLLLSRASDIVPGCDDCFKGIIYHDIIGTEVDFHSESIENFIVFPVEVKDHLNLQESLQSFLTPDEFTGDNMYNADGIGRINACRYHSLMKTPDVLIIQLKRFTYSLLNGEREKLNSRFEFPLELDLDPIMTENVNKAQQQEQKINKNENDKNKSKNKNNFYQGKFQSMPILNMAGEKEENGENGIKDKFDHSRSKNMFDLIGVQMHMGDALSGHYFLYSNSGNGWFKYDDNYVSKFDPGRLKFLAFGGIQPAQYGDPRGIKIENNENAYILYYRKRKQNLESAPKDISPLIDPDDQVIEEEESDSYFDDNSSHLSDENNQYEFVFPDINKKVTEQIEDDILRMITNQTITDPQSRDFLLNSSDLSDDPNFKYDYLVELIQNTTHKHIILSILEKINHLVMNSKDLSTKLLQNEDLHKTFLVMNDKHEVRNKYSQMIIRAIDNVDRPDLYLTFMEHLLDSGSRKHRNEVGYPLIHIVEKYPNKLDPEKWLDITFNHINNIKLSETERTKINFSSLIDSIRLMILLPQISPESREKYRNMTFDMKFFGNLFKSKFNCRSLFNLLLIFKGDTAIMNNFFGTMKNGWDGISPHSAALYFSMLVLLNDESSDENFEWFFKSIKKKPDAFIESFIEELESSTVDGMSTVFVNHSKLWIKTFLLSLSEKVRMNLNNLFNIIFKESNDNEFDSETETESKTENETETEATTAALAATSSSTTTTATREKDKDKDNSNTESENENEKKKKKHRKKHVAFDKRKSRKLTKSETKIEFDSDDAANLTSLLVKNFTTLTDMVIKRNNKKASLYTNGVSTARMYPYATYVELLSMMIQKSSESHRIALNSSKEIIDALKKMCELDMIGADVIKHFMSLLSLIIKNEQQAKTFFNGRTYSSLLSVLASISFDPSTRLTSIHDVSCLISITPSSHIDDFFKSQIFIESVFNCLNSTTDFSTVFGKYIINNANESNNQHLATVFWSDEAFKKNVTNSPQYFYVSSELMKKFSSLSNIFYQLKHPTRTLQAISKGLLIKDDEFSLLGGMQTLAVASFINAFQQLHSNSKNKSKSYESFLHMLHKDFDLIKRIIDRFQDSRNKNEVYQSISQMMIAVYPINSDFQNLVINTVSKGVLSSASYENTRSAGELLEFIIFMLIQKDNSKSQAIEILFNEFKLLSTNDDSKSNANNIIANSSSNSISYDVRKTFIATNILSSEILMVLSSPKSKIDGETLNKFNEYYNTIFNSNKNIYFFTRSTILVLSKLDQEETDKWRSRCAELIPDEVRKIIKSQKKNSNPKSHYLKDEHLLILKYAFEFAFVITNNDNVPVLHKISLTEIEISQFLKICNELTDPSADDLSYLVSKLTQQ